MSTGGRGVLSRKSRVDEARSIDILDLQRKGVFTNKEAWSWTTSWSRNEKVAASVSYSVEFSGDRPTGLQLMYTITDNKTGEKRDYEYTIPVAATPCNYGGERWWYICPLIVNGKNCQRRCRIIYMPSGAEYFGCRECHRLTYESRQRHREKFYEDFARPVRAMDTALEKLKRVRSWDKKLKIYRSMSRAEAVLDSVYK
jgi:hypothetical protein